MVEINPASCRESGAEPRLLESNEAVCLFAFATGASAREMLLPGDAREQRLMLHRVGLVTALIGIVSLTDYCGAEAERRFGDIAWLAPRAHYHAALVEWAMRSSPVFPAPFGTLYLSLNSLTAFIHAHEATIADFLRTVAGKEEWELRISADLNCPEVVEQLAGNMWPDWQTLPKGTRYMRLCRDRKVLVEQGHVETVALVHGFVGELEPLTAAVHQHGVGGRTEVGGLDLIAGYALLVAKNDVKALQECVRTASDRAAHQHIAITLSGPWPPFSFRPNLE
jgi:hypothetical protein